MYVLNIMNNNLCSDMQSFKKRRFKFLAVKNFFESILRAGRFKFDSCQF